MFNFFFKVSYIKIFFKTICELKTISNRHKYKKPYKINFLFKKDFKLKVLKKPTIILLGIFVKIHIWIVLGWTLLLN